MRIDDLKWWSDETGELCHDFDTAAALAMDYMDENDCECVTLYALRPSNILDIDTGDLADALWTRLADMINEYDGLLWDDGGPDVRPYYFRDSPDDDGAERPSAWKQLRNAIAAIVQEHADLSNASWQPTDAIYTIEKGDSQ